MNPKFATRMCFSFAHELGHYFLHKDIYSMLTFSSPEEWRDFIDNVPESEYRKFEWQANEFAGRLLVPHEKLRTEVQKAYDSIRDEPDLMDYLSEDPEAVLSRVSPQLRKPFGVSEEVIETRVRREGLWPPKF